jgi:hypothetical protein
MQRMKISKIFLLITFLSTIFLSLEMLYTPIPAVPTVHASGPFGCNSGVFYEDGSGGMLCITDATSNNNRDNSVNGQFDIGNFGYRTQYIDFQPKVGIGQTIIGYDSSNTLRGGKPFLYPLDQYTGARACSEIDDYSGNNDECDFDGTAACASGTNCDPSNIPYSTLVVDPVSARIDNVYEGAMCVFENLHGTSDSGTIVVCNSVVDQICQDDANLRAAYNQASSELMFYCNQVTGNGRDGSTPVVPNHESPSLAPQPNSNIPSLDWCYTDGSGQHKMGVGSDLVLDNPQDGQAQTEPLKATSRVSNGVCDITQYVTPGESGGVQNCVNSGYRYTHIDECECEFNTKLQQGTGNTYTAIGCVPSTAGAVITVLLSVGIALGAFFALIFIIIGGFEIMTNSTNPDEIKEGQQKIVNAVLGLLLIIFSVVLLRILGVDVLGLSALGQFI